MQLVIKFRYSKCLLIICNYPRFLQIFINKLLLRERECVKKCIMTFKVQKMREYCFTSETESLVKLQDESLIIIVEHGRSNQRTVKTGIRAGFKSLKQSEHRKRKRNGIKPPVSTTGVKSFTHLSEMIFCENPSPRCFDRKILFQVSFSD